MRIKLLCLLLLSLLISCNAALQPTRLDRESVKENSVILSVNPNETKANLSILPSLNTDYYTVLLKDENDNLLKTFYLNKYSHYVDGVVSFVIPSLKENTNYKVEVVSFNSSSETGIVSSTKAFKTTEFPENSKKCYLQSISNSSLLAVYDVLLPSSITFKADKVDIVNLNPNISLTQRDNGDCSITINLFSNGQAASASYVPISVVLNEREEYIIPNLKQINYDSALSLLSDKPTLSQEDDSIVVNMNTSYLISPSFLYKVTKEGTFELIKKFNGNGGAKIFSLADFPSLNDNDEVFVFSNNYIGLGKGYKYSHFSEVLKINTNLEGRVESLNDKEIVISFPYNSYYEYYDAKLKSNLDLEAKFVIYDKLEVKGDRVYLTFSGLKTGLNYTLEIKVGMTDGTTKRLYKEFQTETFVGTYYYIDGSFIFALEVEKAPDNSKYPYYIYISPLDSSFDGVRHRVSPLVDESLGESFTKNNNYSDTLYPYQEAYRWNSKKWNTMDVSPVSWAFDTTTIDGNKVSSIISSVAMGMNVQTYTSFSFRILSDGTKQVIFTNKGYGQASSTVNLGLRKNSYYQSQDLSSEYEYALTENK